MSRLFGSSAGRRIFASYFESGKNKLLTAVFRPCYTALTWPRVRTDVHTSLGAPFRRLLLAPLLFSMACSAGGMAPSERNAVLLDDVIAHVDAGEFKAARAAIDKVLGGEGVSVDHRRAFEFEAERMHRIELDFSLSEQQARDKVRERIPDLKPEEFTAWDNAGLLEHRVIDGNKRYFNRAPSNLY